MEWVSLAYLLALIALLVPVGRLSDAHGRKLMYLYGFVVFTAGSAACGLAPSLGLLIAFRVVQALGAAMLQANSVALVTTSAPRPAGAPPWACRPAPRPWAWPSAPAWEGSWSPPWAGVGVLHQRSRRGVAVVAGYYLLPRTRQRSPAPGWTGGRGAAGGRHHRLAARDVHRLGLSLPAGSPRPARRSAWAGWAFVARQRRVAHPLVDMALLRNPVVSWGLLGAMCGYLVLFGPLVLVPVVLAAQRRSAVAAGLALTALPAGFALAALVADRLLPGACRTPAGDPRGRGLQRRPGSACSCAHPAALVPLLALSVSGWAASSRPTTP